MMFRKIHIVMLGQGELSGSEARPYKAFFDKEEAKECVDKISEELTVLITRWRCPGDAGYTDPNLTPLLHAFGYDPCDNVTCSYLYEDVEMDEYERDDDEWD